MHKLVLPTAAALAAFGAAHALADTIYTASLTPLNNSNVTGNAVLTLSTDMTMLTVEIAAENLEPDMPHPQHIHGRFDGGNNPMDSISPTLADDTDGDGYIEVNEGGASYGPVLLPLSSPPGGAVADFPTAPGGIITFTETYDLTDSSVFAGSFASADLMPLYLREIVLHGRTVADGEGAGTGGEVDGTGGYKASLPVASGVIVPEPTTGLLALVGVMAAGLRRRRSA